MAQSDAGDRGVRSAEVIGALCLATDLGMGYPFEHGLQATLTTMRLCEVLGVDSETASGAYYASLLMHVGCTTDAHVAAHVFHGSMTEKGLHRRFGSPLESAWGIFASLPSPDRSPPIRALQMAVGIPKVLAIRRGYFRAYCEVAEMLAEQLGLPAAVHGLFRFLNERWDGRSDLHRAEGEQIPLAMRVAHVGWDAAYQRLIGGADHAVAITRARAGHAFDPHIVQALVANSGDVLGVAQSAWHDVMAAEPKPWFALEGPSLDRALSAMGRFSDLASPYLSGHSPGVADLAARAARSLGFDEEASTTIKHAGYLLDLGKVAVHPRVWENRSALSADEWEQVRLHPYHTERVLSRSPKLSPLGSLASTHHERLDGCGYPKGLVAGMQSPAARLLAVADAFRSKTEPRAYRAAHSLEDAARILAGKATDGKLDAGMVAAVVEAAGTEVPDVERPAGLTEREVQVLGLVARGLQTKQVARTLGISPKTADRHIQNSYRKIGVSTRAAAALFAAEHGLVPWGELPIPGSGNAP